MVLQNALKRYGHAASFSVGSVEVLDLKPFGRDAASIAHRHPRAIWLHVQFSLPLRGRDMDLWSNISKVDSYTELC